MNLPQEIELYLKETIDYTLNLPVSTTTLELKLQASEAARTALQNQYFALQSQLKQKDEVNERSRAESSMSAQALKRFVEENQKLAQECRSLVEEVALYEHDREALMEFANEADAKARDAESRALDADEQLRELRDELKFYKNQHKMLSVNETKLKEELNLLKERISVLENSRLQESSENPLDCTKFGWPESERILTNSPEMLSPVSATLDEDDLLDYVIAWMVNKDELQQRALAFLKANNGVESCQKLLNIWDRLRPSARNNIALAAEIKLMQNEKEHLRFNLTRAEEEAKVLFEENSVMDEENKRLLKLYNRERHLHGSGEKRSTSASAKGNKRKSSPKTCISDDAMELDSSDSARLPLSPLEANSPNSRIQSPMNHNSPEPRRHKK